MKLYKYDSNVIFLYITCLLQFKTFLVCNYIVISWYVCPWQAYLAFYNKQSDLVKKIMTLAQGSSKGNGRKSRSCLG
jgi:hypothetical protein